MLLIEDGNSKKLLDLIRHPFTFLEMLLLGMLCGSIEITGVKGFKTVPATQEVLTVLTTMVILSVKEGKNEWRRCLNSSFHLWQTAGAQ